MAVTEHEGLRGTAYEPTHPVTETYRKATLLMGKDKPEEAIKVFASEPLDSPCKSSAHVLAGLAWLTLGKHEPAIEEIQSALKLFDEQGVPFAPFAVLALRTIADALAGTDRLWGAYSIYENACAEADQQLADHPELENPIKQEKAHTLSHWGSICLRLEQPDAASKFLAEARKIYTALPGSPPGRLEALLTLVETYRQLEREDLAALALEEAGGVPNLSVDQKAQIELNRIRIESVPIAEAKKAVDIAANLALERGDVERACTRMAVGIMVANKRNEHEWAMELLEKIANLEPKLAVHSLIPARVSFYRARTQEAVGKAANEVAATLIEGARRWCDVAGGRLQLSDYQEIAKVMHDHFRLLARNRLDAGDGAGALVAFETGRARALLAELRNGLAHPLLAKNPFRGGAIQNDLLDHLRADLAVDSVIVTLGILPPDLVCFVVSRDNIQFQTVAFNRQLIEEIRILPEQLRKDRGLAAIPESVQLLARHIQTLVGDRKIVGLTPYRILHTVPWRSLLREVGLPWDKLQFGINFSPALNKRTAIQTDTAIALGFGAAGSIDLNEEAVQFAERFGAQGILVHDARKADLANALQTPRVILLSCHGTLLKEALGPRVSFQLKDEAVFIEEVVPEATKSPLVILSACDSGAYAMLEGDYPYGVAPRLLMSGAAYCACSRFPIRAVFARDFYCRLAEFLRDGYSPEEAFSRALAEMHGKGYDLWRDLACAELLARGD